MTDKPENETDLEVQNDEKPGSNMNRGLRIAAIALLSIIAIALIVLVGMVLAGVFDEAETAPTGLPPAVPTSTGLPQFITITDPAQGVVLDITSPVTVKGEAGALFEGNLVIQVLDAAGGVLAQKPTTVQSPDAGTGGAGPWSVELVVPASSVAPGTAGQIYAYAASPKDGSVVAADSVSISFAGTPPADEGVKMEDHLWMLTSINGSPLIEDSLITLEFESDQAVGLGGCNRYFSGFTVNNSQITFGTVGSTMMFCEMPPGVMEQESAYFNALQEAATYEIEAQQLKISNASGDIALVYDAAVVGRVTAAEGVEFPEGAIVKIRLDDVSLADVPATTVAEQIIQDASQFPVPFSVVYDPAQIIDNHTYGLNVRIEDAAGNLLLINTTAYNVITRGAPSEVDVQVEIVP